MQLQVRGTRPLRSSHGPAACCHKLMPDPVVVIGGGLAGLAAAARLAKVGHQVELYERSETLGGTWAPYQLLPVAPQWTMRRRPSDSRHHGVTCSARAAARWKQNSPGWATPWSRPSRPQ